jgi:hypothetical protein
MRSGTENPTQPFRMSVPPHTSPSSQLPRAALLQRNPSHGYRCVPAPPKDIDSLRHTRRNRAKPETTPQSPTLPTHAASQHEDRRGKTSRSASYKYIHTSGAQLSLENSTTHKQQQHKLTATSKPHHRSSHNTITTPNCQTSKFSCVHANYQPCSIQKQKSFPLPT